MRNRVLMGLTAVAMLACGWFFGSGAFAQDADKPAAAPCVASQWTIHGGEGMPTFLLNTETGETWRFEMYWQGKGGWTFERR